MELAFEAMLAPLEKEVAHLPSRVRSLLWILCSLPLMAERGYFIADESEVRAELYARLPALRSEGASHATHGRPREGSPGPTPSGQTSAQEAAQFAAATA
jgi:hypothetical protein